MWNLFQSSDREKGRKRKYTWKQCGMSGDALPPKYNEKFCK